MYVCRCNCVCVCVCEQESQLKSENIYTYTEIATEVFSELLELIFWRLSTRQIEIVFRERVSMCVCLLSASLLT